MLVYKVQASSQRALESLRRLAVDVRLNAKVKSIEEGQLTWAVDGDVESIQAKTILWAAGVKASSLGDNLASAANANTDAKRRVVVQEDLSVPNHPNLFVLGDLARRSDSDGNALPGVAQVGMQQGKYVAKSILQRLNGKKVKPFYYRDYGNMAVIGRTAAVAEIRKLKLHGVVALVVSAPY